MASRINDRRNRFKQTVDASDSRRRREESSVNIRKNKREEGMAKRRGRSDGPQVNNFTDITAPNGAAVSDAPPAPTTKTYTEADIPALRAGLQATDPRMQYEATRGYRKVLSIEPKPPVQAVLESGAMPFLVNFLTQTQDFNLQFEAAWALTNVASTDETKQVVECGAVPILVQSLLSPNADVREQCAWCLGNIAGDCPELRDLTLQAGALGPLLQNIIQPASESMLRNAIWTLSNFCRGKPQPDLNVVKDAIPVLQSAVANSTDKDVLMDACWALSYLSDGDDARIEAVAASGVVVNLVQLLSHEDPKVVTPALRTLGNIVTGTDGPTQACIDAGCLTSVVPLLSHQKKGIRKESCWMLSNIAAGSEAQITAVMTQEGLMDAVINHVNGAEWDVRKEAAWVISNIATGGSHNQVYALCAQYKGVPAVCGLLDVADTRIAMQALDALKALLKCGEDSNGLLNVAVMVDEADGIDLLEKLQEHENQDIYHKAVTLIETFFAGDEEDEGENIAPAVNPNSFSFGAPVPVTKPQDVGAGALVPAGAFNFNAQSFN